MSSKPILLHRYGNPGKGVLVSRKTAAKVSAEVNRRQAAADRKAKGGKK